jgi:hypothetical protein
MTSFFPHAELTPLPSDRNPSALDIRLLKKELLANALTVPSTRGGGALGHTALCLEPAAYLLLPNAAAWIDPVHPGGTPVLPNNPTAFQIAEGNRVHKFLEEEYQHFKQTEAALRNCIIQATPSHCIDSLDDELFGFSMVTPRELLAHLTTAYAQVTQDDLIANQTSMDTPWDPSTPLTTLWTQLRKAQLFAAAHDAISDDTLMRSALKNLEKSGVFLDALKDWRKKALANQTYATLKTDFTMADKERLRTVTTKDLGFVAGNAQKVQNKENENTEGLYYCWTHGLSKSKIHTSVTCIRKMKGHRDEATAFNMLGGNNRIRREKDEKIVWRPSRPPNNKTSEPSGEN